MSTNFFNWADTLDIEYTNILYPTEYSPYNGEQISSIQQFVKVGAHEGKRVRGSGNRHSWSNIFADP
jgi:hypothetical protein